ncbi:MAG: succinate dehydrogenase cytochrome b subunit [Bacteroidia bacterium]|nr:succinate dehydrogenase cytochrome b subunit [Bacteroidia bacterium]
MNWFTTFITSSIGKKIVMALTGLFLITFLLVHCSVNACIFFNDGGETFNEVAEFFGSNPVIRTMEIVLFICLILHIIQGLVLWGQNGSKRPVKYTSKNGAANSTWYSRSMGLLGTLLLMFLIVHLKDFWVVSRFTDEITGGSTTLYAKMNEAFDNIWVVVLYVFSMFSLSYHLLHGFQSAFRTMGWTHRKYTPLIKAVGAGFAVLIPFIFAMMPIVMHFNLID